MTHRLSTCTAALLTLCILLAFGCSSSPRTSDRNLTIIDDERVVALLQEPEASLLIDVRPADRFAESHIAGAINIPLPDLRAHDPRLANAQNLIVYGAGGNDILSPAAAKKLIVLGYSGVYDFRGGLQQWKANDRPVESDETADE